jgi:hypothetical protein
MKQEPHWLLVPLSLVTVLSGTAPQASAPGTNARVVIIRANLIDGVLSQPLHDATATVRDGHIESVTTGAGQIPPGAADWTSVLAVPGFVDAHTHTSDLRAAVWPFPRARPPYATSGRIISRPGPALAGKAIPQDGPEDLGASQYAPAHRSRYLRPTAALSAIVCRNLPNAEAGAVSLHLHFNLSAEIRIAEGELLEPVPVNGAEGAEVRVARAMEQAHEERSQLVTESLVRGESVALPLAQRASLRPRRPRPLFIKCGDNQCHRFAHVSASYDA